MEKLLKLKIRAYYKFIRIIKRATESIMEAYDISDEEIYMSKLAVAEAAANVIEHSYKGETDDIIEFEIEKNEKEWYFTIKDYGCKMDLCEIKSRNLEDYKEGGLGVHIIKSVMDSTEYSHFKNGTKLKMIKKMGADKRWVLVNT